MSQDDNLLFAPPESLVMSDFSSLAELDDFQKDLFLGDTMEAIAEGDPLEELDCKDGLKLMSDVNDVFEASMKARADDIKDSIKAQDGPFTLFVDAETNGALQQFMSMSSQLDLQTVSAGIDLKSFGLTNTVASSAAGSTLRSDMPSHTALVAAKELNCMSLEDLDELAPLHATDTLCLLTSPLDFKQGMSLASSGEEVHLSSIAPSMSTFEEDVTVGSTMFEMDHKSQGSNDLVNSPLQMKPPSGFLPSKFCKSDVSSSAKTPNGSQLKSAPFSPVSANSKQESTDSGIFGVPLSDVPSLQRSQSSSSLGQCRAFHGLEVCADDTQPPPACKQDAPPVSAAGMNLFSLSPYQACSTSNLAPMRRVFSTGDLQLFNGMQSLYGIKVENAIPEDTTGMRIGHYTLEERKMKLHRYRQKRTERNFSKKIKYACRKTLADNRPRVRGRFARSDEMGDPGFKGSDVPIMEGYDSVASHRLLPQLARDQQAYIVINNSCVMPSTHIPQFWNTVGMKVAM